MLPAHVLWLCPPVLVNTSAPAGGIVLEDVMESDGQQCVLMWILQDAAQEDLAVFVHDHDTNAAP
jgi:hypothetical protein